MNNGQVCTAVKRVSLERAIAESFIWKWSSRCKRCVSSLEGHRTMSGDPVLDQVSIREQPAHQVVSLLAIGAAIRPEP